MNLSASKGNNGQGSIDRVKTSYLREPVGGRLALIGITPVWKEALTVAMLIIESTSSFHLTECFILYAAINALAILFVVLIVPETRGKPWERIQESINR
ncbi:uncharacterized protein Pyn_01738 [Prunus yedoensis var. nudiflora]|uniref:Uncharacterized protein n=1 Tax=Prunus yedoensis var. nudiflora TaxID=2094558 RepID=A0A314U9F8_PRUYE|nr:uncharacterized protein Pyn_01738 [Prunus yedoensis var. nudiflora]